MASIAFGRISGEAPPVAPERAPDRQWDLLLWCLAAYLFTAVGRIHQLFPALSAVKPVLVSGGLALGLYLLAARGSRRPESVLRFRTTAYLAGFLCWAALSVPGALWVSGSLSVVVNLAKMIVLSLVLAAALRGPLDVERMAFAYFLAAATYAAVVLARFEVGSDAWRLGALYYYDANDFATLAVSAVPLGLHFAVTPGALRRRVVAGAGLAALGVVIVWSGSRGGFLALLACGAYLLFRYRAIATSWRIVATAVIAVVFVAAASDRYWQTMATLLHPQEDYNVSDMTGRLHVWGRGVGYMTQHPLLGVGAGNFPTAEGRLSPLAQRAARGYGVKWSAAHNSFVQVGAELGVPGVLLFGAVFWSVLRRLRHAARVPDRRMAGLAQALTASLVGFLTGAVFLSLAYSEMLYALVALGIGLAKVSAASVARR